MNEKLRAAVYGFAVGDALGVPYEFKQRGTFRCSDMVGFGTWNQPPGTWSDDTSLLLATCDSIRENDMKIDLEDIMMKFYKWRFKGEYSARGEVFDVGNTTELAIRKYVSGVPAIDCGSSDEHSNGNGSLMRILPLAFLRDITYQDIKNVSKLTHGHDISVQKCIEFVFLCQTFIENPRTKWAMLKPKKQIKSTGYVVDTFEAALWCVVNTKDYKSCVLKAVNLGGDTDTIAAIAGGVAGIKYGFNAIPPEWIKQLANKELIDKCLF